MSRHHFLLILTVTLSCLANPKAAAANHEPNTEDEKPARTENASPINLVKYNSGRWFGDTFQYSTGKDFASPTTSYVAKEKGVFLNKAKQRIAYEKGDILFQIKNNADDLGWFVADAATPKVAVPSPAEDFIKTYKAMRPGMTYDERLSKAACAHAQRMANENYFGQTDPDGKQPNQYAIEAGFPLPYGAGGNTIESIGAGKATGQDALNQLLGDEAHKRHLTGMNFNGTPSEFSSHTHFGVCHIYKPGSQYGHYWSFMSSFKASPQMAAKQ